MPRKVGGGRKVQEENGGRKGRMKEKEYKKRKERKSEGITTDNKEI